MRPHINGRSIIAGLGLAAVVAPFSACKMPDSYVDSLRQAQTSIDQDVTLDKKDPEGSIMRRIESEMPRSLYGEDRQGLEDSIQGYYKVLLEMNPHPNADKLHGTIKVKYVDMNYNGHFG